MDLCFPGEENNDKKLTGLVVRERQTRMTLSSGVPSKSNGEFMAKRVVAFMREIGIDKGDITAKTDHEPAMLAALSEIARHRAAAGGSPGAQPGWRQQGKRSHTEGRQERRGPHSSGS